MCFFKTKFSDNALVSSGFYDECFKVFGCCAFSGNVLYPAINTHITVKTFGRI